MGFRQCPSALSRYPNSALQVLPTGDRFNMVRIYTTWGATKMVSVQSFRNKASIRLISETMSNHVILSIPHIAVPCGGKGGNPYPAARVWFRVILFFKLFS